MNRIKLAHLPPRSQAVDRFVFAPATNRAMRRHAAKQAKTSQIAPPGIFKIQPGKLHGQS